MSWSSLWLLCLTRWVHPIKKRKLRNDIISLLFLREFISSTFVSTPLLHIISFKLTPFTRHRYFTKFHRSPPLFDLHWDDGVPHASCPSFHVSTLYWTWSSHKLKVWLCLVLPLVTLSLNLVMHQSVHYLMWDHVIWTLVTHLILWALQDFQHEIPPSIYALHYTNLSPKNWDLSLLYICLVGVIILFLYFS